MVELTRRQLQVLRLVGSGRHNKEAARDLGLDVSTVKNHLSEARRRLGVENSLSAVVLAIAEGILDARELAGAR
jgi:DNA-binding NarL/FixJ family response regulator